jgi:hypothetical protein
MASSIAVTTTRFAHGIDKVSIDWTSHTDGSVSNTFDLDAPGELMQVGYTPDGGGTQPTDAYDFTISDPDGADALGGTGANLSNSVATKVTPVQSTYFRRLLPAGTYTVTGAACGSAKGGLIDLYLRALL